MGKSLKISDNMDAVTLSPSEGTELIVGLYKSGAFHRTPIFKGAPGIGKTSFVKAAYEQLLAEYPNAIYIELNPTMPADEIGGIPDLVREEGKTTRTNYAVPSWFPDDPEAVGILCLDDCLQGDKFTQTVLANLLQARNLRGHPLPEGIMIVGTGNRAEDNAGSNKMLTHLADRVTIFNIEADPISWINDFALPQGIDARIISYIQQNQEKLNMFDPKKEKCATSRTWAAVSGRMAYIDSLKGTPNYEKFAQAILVGELGMAEGALFWQYCGIESQIPNIDEILADPENASIDYPIDVKHATAVKLAKVLDADSFESALKYVNRLGADMAGMAVKLAARDKPELQDTDAFANWAVANQELLHDISG